MPGSGKNSTKSFQHTMILTPLPPWALFASQFLVLLDQPPLPLTSFSSLTRRGMINSRVCQSLAHVTLATCDTILE